MPGSDMTLAREEHLVGIVIESQAVHCDPTEAWNRAIARGGQPGDDAAAVAFRKRTKAIVRKSRWTGR